MKKVLFVNACVRPQSRTLVLARQVLGQLGGEVEEVDLGRERLRPLDWEQLRERDRLAAEKDFSGPLFRYANQWLGADEILVAAPYWDLSFPAALRVYLEHITITGLTFRYTPDGRPEGLCRAGRLIYVTTSGGPMGDSSYGYGYIRTLANTFYGIGDVRCFRAENLDIFGADVEGILQKALGEIAAAGL